MDFFDKNNEFTQKKMHLEYILNQCLMNLNEQEAHIMQNDIKQNGNYHKSFFELIDVRISFWISEFIDYHEIDYKDVFSIPNEVPPGPKYVNKLDQFEFILEAFFIMLIIQDKYGDIRPLIHNLNTYAKNNLINIDKLNEVLVFFQNTLKQDIFYSNDIRKLALRKVIKDTIENNF